MVYILKKNITYIAIDESPIGGDCSNLIIVGAESKNESLIRQSNVLIPKAGDYINNRINKNNRFEQQAIQRNETNLNNPLYYPKLEELVKKGLDNFSWIRASHGRSFSRQVFEHASIGELILSGEHDPQKIVVLIDSFYRNSDTKYLLREYLKRNNFNLPIENIECHDGGDQYIPLINFADLIAFRIGNYFRKMQKEYAPWRKDLPVKELDVYGLPIIEKRIKSVGSEGRKLFSDILKAA